jgi:hypothetical protein
MTVPIAKNRCTYITEKGHRCRRPRLEGQDFCLIHTDSLASEEQEAAQKLLASRLDLDTVEGIHLLLARTVRSLARGRIPTRRATALGYLAQVLLASLERLRSERREGGLDYHWDAIKQRALVDAFLDNDTNLEGPDQKDSAA